MPLGMWTTVGIAKHIRSLQASRRVSTTPAIEIPRGLPGTFIELVRTQILSGVESWYVTGAGFWAELLGTLYAFGLNWVLAHSKNSDEQ